MKQGAPLPDITGYIADNYAVEKLKQHNNLPGNVNNLWKAHPVKVFRQKKDLSHIWKCTQTQYICLSLKKIIS